MSLKLKVVILFLCVFISYLAANLLIHRMIVFPSFVELENEEARKDALRAVQAIQREIDHLDDVCHDWASWDDTYAFAATRSEEYIKTNLPENLFKDLRLNLLQFFDDKRRLVYGQTRKASSYAPFEPGVFKDGSISPDPPLLTVENENISFEAMKTAGIFMTDRGPMLVASRPILNNQNQGPIGGTLIMGRFLDPTSIEAIADLTRISLEILPIHNDSLPARLREIVAEIGPDSPFRFERKAAGLRCFTVLSDIEGRPALLLTVKTPGDISKIGFVTIGYAWLTGSSAAVLVLLLALWMMQRTVIGPVSRLSEHALSIGRDRDLSRRLSMPKADEIGKLGYIFDDMVARLDESVSQLAKSEEMYRMITEHTLSIILLIQDGGLIFANRKAVEMSGYRPEELMHKPATDLIHPEDVQWLEKIPQADDYLESIEIRYMTRSGQTRWVKTLAVPIDYKGGKTILVHGIDITDQKKVQLKQKELESRLQRVEKMEMIGTLVGGVAHDLNNILSGLVTYPEIMLLDMPEDSPLHKALSTILKSGKKAEAIVQDLLTLSRRGVACSEVVCLNEIVASYLDSPEHYKMMSFIPNVEMTTSLDENLLNIVGSPVHLSKTLMNLVSNAAESISGGGRIHISTENRYLNYPVHGYDTVREGDYVRLTVSDTGSGICEADREKIFEPFYTKKVMGRSGTGLGLSVVWSTVKDHQGYIHLESEVGKGSSFHLYFPVTLKIAQRTASAVSPDMFRGNNEKILVVDDLAEQRKIATEMLKLLGYRVESVSSGEAALEYLRHNPADLILLDMIMEPGIDGLETYRRILGMRPKQKAIIVSGYSETDRVKEMKILGVTRYVKKPYMLEKIGLAIRRELEKPE